MIGHPNGVKKRFSMLIRNMETLRSRRFGCSIQIISAFLPILTLAGLALTGCSQRPKQQQYSKAPLAAYEINYSAVTKDMSIKSVDVTPPSAGRNITGKAGLFQIGNAMFNGNMVTATIYIINNDTVPWTGVEMQAYSIISGSPTGADTDLGTGWYINSPAIGAWGWLFTSGTAGSTYTIPVGGRSANKIIGFNATSNFDALVYIYVDAPVITGITSGTSGSTITISGYNFLDTQGSVFFNGVSAPVQTWSDTSIVVILPAPLTFARVIVETNDPNTPYSNSFTLTNLPQPQSPTNLTANVGNNQITLSWGPSSIETYTHTLTGCFSAVVADNSGNIWAANECNNNVIELSPDGALIGTYPVGLCPRGITIDSSGNVWVANNGDNNVTELSATGISIGTYAVGSEPTSIAIDSSGNAWVVDYGDNTVTELSATGISIGTYAVGGCSEDIAIDGSGNVWVTNGCDNTVTKMNSNGTTIGVYAVGSYPWGVATDTFGNVLIADYFSNTVTELNSTGSIIGTYPVGSAPRYITIDSLGNIWITNYSGDTVTELSPAGVTIGTYPAGSGPEGITIDPSGNVWVTDNNGGDTVTELVGAANHSYNIYYSTTPLGPYTQLGFTTTTSYTVTGLTNGMIYYFRATAVNSGGESGYSNQVSVTLNQHTYTVGNGPAGIAIDSPGNIWVANQSDNTVTELSSTGTTIGTYSVGSDPMNIAIDSSGNIWVTNGVNPGTVTKLSSTGSTIGTYPVGSYPAGIAIDSSGNVWVTNVESLGTVTKLSSTGSTIGAYTVGPDPWGIAIDTFGDVWITNFMSSSITELSATGVTIGTYTACGMSMGIAIDGSGNVWCSDSYSGTVTKLSSTGSTIGTYNIGTNPSSIAIDDSGNVLVTNSGSNSVTELSPLGNTIVTYSVGNSPNGVAIDGSGNIWVTNNGDNTVTELVGATTGPQFFPYTGPIWP